MSDDLTLRLRNAAVFLTTEYFNWNAGAGLLREAADRIEELEAKLAKAEELQEAQKLFNLYAVQILMLGATVSRLQNLENAWVNLKTQAELTGGKDE